MTTALRALLARQTIREMIKFGIVGFTTLILDFTVYISLTRGLPYFRIHFLQANTIAVIVDLIWNFYWNNRWTFSRRGLGSLAQYVSYFAVAGTGFGWNQFMLWLLVTRLGAHDLLAKLVAIAIVFFWNFSLQRTITFGKVAAFVERRRTRYN